MAIVRYNATGELDSLQRQLNRLFDEFFIPSERQLTYSVPAELQVTDEAVVLNLEVPGIKAEDIDIQVTREQVSITGERKQEATVEDKGLKHSEFCYGKFKRVITLPVLVDNVHTKAEYKDGILRLTLPKAEEEKTKVVKVQIS
jgi:HSP20 family protein